MRYVLVNFDSIEVNDPSDLTDEEFETIANENGGRTYHNTADFESAFNGEQMSTTTDQLRIIGPDYKAGFQILQEYFDSISDEEKPKVHEQLAKLGL